MLLLLLPCTMCAQVGLFDLVSGQVLQQVPLLAHRDATSATARPLPAGSPFAEIGGRGSWDSSGRVLYAAGLLAYSVHDAAGDAISWEALPSIAAVDFGSWHGRKQRWHGSSGSVQEAAAAAAAGGDGQQAEAGGAGVASQCAGGSGGSSGQQRRQGRSHWAQGGQVLHRELHVAAAPTAMVAAGGCGEMLVGTHAGVEAVLVLG